MLRSLLAIAGAAVMITVTQACSYAWAVTIDVEIADDVDVPESAQLVVIQTDQAPPEDERMPDDAPWGAEASDTTTLGAEQRTYTYEGGTCCSPVETNYSWAYLDLDGNGEYDPGEPYAADPDNPVEVDADYAVTLVIRNPQ